MATTDPARYSAMGDRAAELIRDYSSDAVVREQLRDVFAGIVFPPPAMVGEAETEPSPGAGLPRETAMMAQAT